MRAGDVLLDRFEIERLAGTGGMGEVYRAFDRERGEPVAIKRQAQDQVDADRFTQEARVLADLAHPAIVRYVAHGKTPLGDPFLAMEWLDGEDLGRRLQRQGLTLDETLAVLQRAAQGLAVAHARNVVHRDIKPSNLFLVGGDPRQTKVLDFGIARHQARTAITRTGLMLGTIGYMAPEQAGGARDVDARADVFALGCVLFECLTGRPAFTGDHPVAILAKVLREDPPHVRELRPDLPQALDDLVARALSKNREERPEDASAMLRALERVRTGTAEERSSPAPIPPRSEVLTGSEQRLVSVMLVDGPADDERNTADRTLGSSDPAGGVADPLRAVLAPFGAEVVALASGTLLVTTAARGSATDQAVRAAAAALAIRRASPHARCVLSTGRATTTGRWPVGPAIDRAASMLASLTDTGTRASGVGPTSIDAIASREGIFVDDVTAGLLDARYEIEGSGRVRKLVRERTDLEGVRTLLGKRTPCVGREKELALLESTLAECIDESVARAVLVTAQAGTGKSRLRQELLARVRKDDGVRVLIARAEAMAAGSALALARQLIRHAFDLREGDPGPEQDRRIREGLAGRFAVEADLARVADFLGEIVGVASSNEPSPQLRSARNDPRILREWMQRSFVEWLASESARGPVVVVLEDLHWGDLPSVTYLGEALRALDERPWLVLAFARPEVHDVFPKLWSHAALQEIRLANLTKRSAERLARAVLENATEQTIARIVERADGNAFYLEELIRRVAEEDSEELPETVLAMVQSRLEREDPEARRVLRAASVFGDTFFEGGVAALLGSQAQTGAGTADRRHVASWLQSLVDREVLVLAGTTRFVGEPEYTFRHNLLREAAYATLTESDRAKGHLLAAQWLEQVGERDALVMAGHFEKGGERARAVPWLLRGAEAAFSGGNLDAAVQLSDRAVAHGAQGAERGRLRLIAGLTYGWRGEFPRGFKASREAMDLLPAGTSDWFLAAAGHAFAASYLGDRAAAGAVVGSILSLEREPPSTGPYAFAMLLLMSGSLWFGQPDMVRAFFERLELAAANNREPKFEPAFAGWHALARLIMRVHFLDDIASAITIAAEGVALFDQAGDAFGRAQSRLYQGWALAEAGAAKESAAAIDDAVRVAKEFGTDYVRRWAMYYRARAALTVGDHAAVLETAASFGTGSDLLTLLVRATRAAALHRAGRSHEALTEATSVVEEAQMLPNPLGIAECVLAEIALSEARHHDALVHAERAVLTLERRATLPSVASLFHLIRAEAKHAMGDVEGARSAIAEARDRVLRNAGPFRDPMRRKTYLERVEANARTLRRAREWLE